MNRSEAPHGLAARAFQTLKLVCSSRLMGWKPRQPARERSRARTLALLLAALLALYRARGVVGEDLHPVLLGHLFLPPEVVPLFRDLGFAPMRAKKNEPRSNRN